eukprot:33208-Eustigmatos_ZCMA.PRE.1
MPKSSMSDFIRPVQSSYDSSSNLHTLQKVNKCFTHLSTGQPGCAARPQHRHLRLRDDQEVRMIGVGQEFGLLDER